MIVSTALLCLAASIYNEARGEPIMGQYAVAMVTLNRAKRDPKKVCEVVFKPKQFSWTNDGAAKKVPGGWKLASYVTPKNDHAWWLAQKIAKQSLSGRMPDFTRGATYYHERSIRPKWARAFTPTKKLGNHIFYAAVDQSLLTSL